jgi:predicted deacylase
MRAEMGMPTQDHALPDLDVRLPLPDLAPWRAGNTGIPGAWRFTAAEPGPHLLVTALVHGNEIAGALLLSRWLRAGLRPRRGTLTLCFANLAAFDRFDPADPTASRFVDEDLNRVWAEETLGGGRRSSELERARALLPLVRQADVLLDLHSFHSPGEPFAMLGPANNTGTLQAFALAAQEEALAARLGPRRLVEGWLETYADGVAARVQRAEQSDDPRTARARLLNTDPRYGIGTTEYMRSAGGMAITLECGQHDDPAGPTVAHRAILNTMAHLGMIDGPAPAPVEQTIDYDQLYRNCMDSIEGYRDDGGSRWDDAADACAMIGSSEG